MYLSVTQFILMLSPSTFFSWNNHVTGKDAELHCLLQGLKCSVVLTPLFVPGLVGQFVNIPFPAGAVESACLAFVN